MRKTSLTTLQYHWGTLAHHTSLYLERCARAETRMYLSCRQIWEMLFSVRSVPEDREVGPYARTHKSVRQSVGSYARGRCHLTDRKMLSPEIPTASLHAGPFPSWEPSGRIDRLAQVTNSMSVPLLSFSHYCLIQIQPDEQDQLLGNIPRVRETGVGIGGLYR